MRIPQTFGGMRVVVHDTTPTPIRRTWCERLFGWPWNPWVAVKYLRAPMDPDEGFVVNDEIHCGEVFYERLKAATMDGNQ